MGSEQRRGVGAGLTESTPYLGALGKTRTEMAQVWMPDGKLQALAVYTGVDAAADPALARIARTGTLHQLGQGVALAIPFTFHDPTERVFVLVVPEGLRHRALALRAEHMALIAADVERAVPDYVRDCETVIGAAGLVARLDSGAPNVALRDVPLSTDATLALLRERERSIERRERLLNVREQGVHLTNQSLPARAVLDSELQEVDADEPLEYGETVLAERLDAEDREDAELLDGDDELEDVEELDDAEDFDDPDEVDDLADADDDDGQRAYGFAERSSSTDAVSPHLVSDGSTPLPPGSFADDESAQLCLIESEGRVWLFVRGRPPAPRDTTDLDLLVQLDPDREPPLVLFTLIFDLNGPSEVLRGVIDLEDPEQARALDLLAQKFVVQLVSLDPEGQLEHWATLKGPREQNVRAVLAHVSEHPHTREEWLLARERVATAPPSYRDLDQPFLIPHDGSHAVSATEAAVALDELVEWLLPERRARLILLFSVPPDVIDTYYRVGMCDALDWGLALPDSLKPMAAELALAEDEARLLERRIAGLCRTSREPDYGGLEAGVLRALWSDAVERAAAVGVELSTEAEALLREHVGDRARSHASGLAEASGENLAPLRAALHPEGGSFDLEKLLELAAHGSHRDLLELGAASANLSPEDATALFIRMLERKDGAAVDALRSLLAHSHDVRVRACAALSLAALRAVDAIDDLARCLKSTGEPDWRLFARCLGRYGVGSFRAIQRALEAQNSDEERTAYVYAHLALHGARAQLRARARSEDAREVRIAEHAISLASELKDANTPALALEKQGALTVFCELFDRSLRVQGA